MKLRLSEWPKWDDAVNLLKVKPTQCPQCDKGISIYKDTSKNAEWLYCPACEYAGSPLDIVCYCTGKNVSDAIMLLLNSKDASEVDSRDLEHYRTRELFTNELTNLWKNAVEELHHADNCRSMRTQVGLPDLTPEDYFDLLGGPIIAPYEWTDLTDIMKKKLYGDVWKRAYVSPLYDLPGRLSGMYFSFERDGRRRERVLYLKGYSGYAGRYRIPNSEKFKNKLFVCYDILSGIRLAYRYAKFYSTMPPIVACSDSTETIKASFDDKDIVLLAEKTTGKEIRLARLTNAKIFETGKFEDVRPEVLKLENMHHRSQSWKSRLDHILDIKDKPEIKSIITEAGLKDGDMEEVAEEAQKSTQDKIDNVLGLKSVEYGKVLIEERDDGLFSNKTTRLTDYRFRVEEIIVSENNNHTLYRCRVIKDGKDYTTIVREKDLKYSGMEEVVKCLRPFHVHINTFVRNHTTIIEVAKIFGNPSVSIRETSLLGFDISKAQLTFPSCRIDVPGRKFYKQDTTLPSNLHIPWEGIQEPRPLSKEDLQWLMTIDHKKIFFWHTVCWIVSTLLAPLRKETPRVYLVGNIGYFNSFMEAVGFKKTLLKATYNKYKIDTMLTKLSAIGYYPGFIDVHELNLCAKHAGVSMALSPVMINTSPEFALIGMLSQFNVQRLCYYDDLKRGMSLNTFTRMTGLFNNVISNLLQYILIEKDDVSLLIRSNDVSVDKFVWKRIKRWLHRETGEKLVMGLRYNKLKGLEIVNAIYKMIMEGRLNIVQSTREVSAKSVYVTKESIIFHPDVFNKQFVPEDREVVTIPEKIISILERDKLFICKIKCGLGYAIEADAKQTFMSYNLHKLSLKSS